MGRILGGGNAGLYNLWALALEGSLSSWVQSFAVALATRQLA